MAAKKQKRQTPRKGRGKTDEHRGKLRIGDDWNAITIIALSQSNPLKAIAEFVENSIDAGAKNITITRGKEKGEPYISVTDDGAGIPKNNAGIPDFHYVATHICDSVKKRLKEEGRDGIQGEFGIGLLSFWTLGETLTLTCTGDDGITYEMRMRKGDTDYAVNKRRFLFESTGTQLKVQPLLSGMRQLSGQKMQWYLASELRDRIRRNDINLRILDRTGRKEFKVEPREYDGRLLHHLPETRTREGDIYLELYMDDPDPSRKVGLYRNGTRVLEDIAELEELKANVWGAGYLEGIVDIPFINLTPGTRLGIIRDDAFTRAWFALRPVEVHLETMIEDLKKAEEEKASKEVMKSIKRAFREALLALPAEEYDWFDIQAIKDRERRKQGAAEAGATGDAATSETTPDAQPGGIDIETEAGDEAGSGEVQREFFEYAGPLHSVRISPASSVIKVGESRSLQAIARDKSRRRVDHGVAFHWEVLEGNVSLDDSAAEIVTVYAGREPGLARIKVAACQSDIECQAEALVTVTESLGAESLPSTSHQAGLPNYTFKKAPGELWRSQYDEDQNLIVINNGHRDFIYASRTKALQLRYIARLFAKELVYKNFPGYSADKLLERMIELSLYTEENLK